MAVLHFFLVNSTLIYILFSLVAMHIHKQNFQGQFIENWPWKIWLLALKVWVLKVRKFWKKCQIKGCKIVKIVLTSCFSHKKVMGYFRFLFYMDQTFKSPLPYPMH